MGCSLKLIIPFLYLLKYGFSLRFSFCDNKLTTYLAIGTALVSPGDSIPVKFIIFCMSSLNSIFKSSYPPCSFPTNLGLIPEKFLMKCSFLI